MKENHQIQSLYFDIKERASAQMLWFRTLDFFFLINILTLDFKFQMGIHQVLANLSIKTHLIKLSNEYLLI